AKEITGDTKLSFGEKTIDVTPPWPRKDFLELFKEKDIDPANEEQLRGILREKGVDTAGMDLTKMVDEVFGEVIEPDLQDATFVTGQPIEMTPLCRQIPDRPGFADRFESYMAGMELANAYTELNDPQEQRKRLVEQVGEEVIEQGKVDEDFLLAMEHGMPPAGGIGIGIDRLVMLLTNNPSIREVILFPQLREAESANIEE
ncbi:MAG: amino acid--tRNA ligase-related protein, partial [Planctomycetota bacterium]|nr:amino acid--tRNA ligase-related protein [Planctomycetota bacterium]